MKIGGITPAQAATAPRETDKNTKVSQVASEFESLLLKQILEGAKVCGKKDDAYTGMAVTGLADALAKAGGTGLAKQLEEALSPRHEITPQVPPKKSVTG